MPPKILKLALRPFGYAVTAHQPQHDPNLRLVRVLQAQGISLVFDVGANRGQFAKRLIKSGYRGRIVSFEPLSGAHARLQAAAAGKPDWIVFRRCALGPEAGMGQINVAGNLQSSSILPMLDRHLSLAPQSRYVDIEETEIVTLDDVLSGDFPGARNVGLKMDVQGYESEVLKGLRTCRDAVSLILTEASLTPLYEGGQLFWEMAAGLTAEGFRCVSVAPHVVDPETYEVLQVDALFVRSPPPA